MRSRTAAVLLALAVAGGHAVAAAPSAAACAYEDCPLVCRVIGDLLGEPPCWMQGGGGPIEGGEPDA